MWESSWWAVEGIAGFLPSRSLLLSTCHTSYPLGADKGSPHLIPGVAPLRTVDPKEEPGPEAGTPVLQVWALVTQHWYVLTYMPDLFVSGL